MPLFYLCQTDAGPQLEPNQTSAKLVDPNFVKLEFANDKDGLRQGINDLLRQVAEPTVASEPIVIRVPERQPMTPGACPVCTHNEKAAQTVVQGRKATSIEEAIFDIDRDYLLKNIIEAATARHAELEG